MIHFQPETSVAPAPYVEAVERLRSVRKALALVELFDGRAKRDLDEIRFDALFLDAPEAVQRCADGRSVQAAGAAAAGIEALIGAESAGETPNPAAIDVLSDSLRRDLQGIHALFVGRA
ncbi:hypothetical protein GCM10022280_24620 [Sphingomonas swuensis]|uniref:Uncharacterized protein n=1 Tax=Sphingomonas swuensis TaxID=977800 RepID=A0ABP7TB75_9SPHN